MIGFRFACCIFHTMEDIYTTMKSRQHNYRYSFVDKASFIIDGEGKEKDVVFLKKEVYLLGVGFCKEYLASIVR